MITNGASAPGGTAEARHVTVPGSRDQVPTPVTPTPALPAPAAGSGGGEGTWADGIQLPLQLWLALRQQLVRVDDP
ncbi:hypothetical protein ABZ943_41890, partial [Streptomyces rubiginosohelvolus]|uniref:hypothetical protein n=1 Tax=Streptomyces rubiginosohelvolus TaxID=67362 RepID=UPI0033CEF419